MHGRLPIAIVGGGLAGTLLAILLARRGCSPVVFERDLREDADDTRGRTINLALAARGLKALDAAGLSDSIAPLLIPMAGRIVHDESGKTRFLAYGQYEHEKIYSVSRAGLNRALVKIARERYNIDYRFGHRCIDVDLATGAVILEVDGQRTQIAAELTIAADGAGSVVRKTLAAAGAVTAEEELLDHGYKELTVPPNATGEFALPADGLHIWPRGGHMLIALPNLDKSFTATLFLPQQGSPSFANLDPANVHELFRAQFNDAFPLIPALEREFQQRPIGLLGTVRCYPWTHEIRSEGGTNRILLLGDAAHAIVPFHGQGMNAAFEDCLKLDRLVADHGQDWGRVLPAFEKKRTQNAHAIAEMALENYREMRDEVRDPSFELKKTLSFELERRFAGRFIPRYSMVMFHPEISYSEAAQRGAAQAEILARLMAGKRPIDMALAENLIDELL